MKKLLLSLAVITLLIPALPRTSSAQQNAKPPLVPALSDIIAQRPVPGTLSEHFGKQSPVQPANCNPCLFYGGDADTSNAVLDGNTLLIADTAVYIPFVVPAGQRWDVMQIFVSIIPTNTAGQFFDPETAGWSISSGLSEGNGGTVIATGLGPMRSTPTGRTVFGLQEYFVQVKIGNVKLRHGEYWLELEPQCTDSSNSICSSEEYFAGATNRKQDAFGPPEPLDQSYWRSSQFDIYYVNTDTLGMGLDAFSAGVVGRSR